LCISAIGLPAAGPVIDVVLPLVIQGMNEVCVHASLSIALGERLPLSQLDDATLDEHSYLFLGNVSKALYGKYDVTLTDFVDKILTEAVAQDGIEHDSDADTDSDDDA
jgi:hypothetical protein